MNGDAKVSRQAQFLKSQQILLVIQFKVLLYKRRKDYNDSAFESGLGFLMLRSNLIELVLSHCTLKCSIFGHPVTLRRAHWHTTDLSDAFGIHDDLTTVDIRCVIYLCFMLNHFHPI